jgi:sugar phosphate isomerase/epimerase
MPRFRYCLNASTIRTTPILQQIRAAGEAGYEGIELWHDAIDDYLRSGGTLASLRAALSDHQLAVPTTIYLGGWFDATAEAYPHVLDECRRRMQQAAELGATHVIAGPAAGACDVPLGAARYAELLRCGREWGVLPAMEFLGFVGQLNTIESALEVMELSGQADATIVLDPFHIFRGGGSVESIAKLTASQIAISHFNDTPASPPREEQHDHCRVMPGDGHLNLRQYVRLLADTGYDRFLSLELFREDLWSQDPTEVARRGLERMRDVVES